MKWGSMEKFLLLIQLLFTRPTWAWAHIWFSHYNPLNFSKQYIKRYKEYDQHEIPLTEILQRACASSPKQVKHVLDEFKQIQLNRDSGSIAIPTGFDAAEELICLCYCIVRLARPSTIVETGVGRGVNSYFVLRALKKNGHGHLYSIELPMLRLHAEQDVGKFVPSSLRSRWTLILGPGVYEMQKLRNKFKSIDMFVHDSNHNYLNQLAEYKIALDWLKKGGITVSDDVGNDALLEANDKLGGQLMVTRQPKHGYFGIIVK